MTNSKKKIAPRKKASSKRINTASKIATKAAVKKTGSNTRKNSPKETNAKNTRSERASKKTLVLDPVLVINNAKQLSQDFNQLLQHNDDITIDASEVEMIDTAILQLLLAVSNKAKASKQKVKWLKPSENFISNVTLLGLSKTLGLS